MRAAIFRETGALTIEDVTTGTPGAHEVLVRVAAAGLCHTDLHFLDGHLELPGSTVLGHETAGVVEAVGEHVQSLKVGDHVIGCLSAYCGSCEQCLSGRPSICENGTTLQRGPEQSPRLSDSSGNALHQFMNLSAFAEKIVVHEHALARVDKAIPLDRAALIGCAVMTGFGAVTRTAQIKAGESVAVIGCGAVGLSIVQAAALAGALDVIAIDVNPARLDLASRLGATVTIDSRGIDVVEAVREATAGKGAHAVFEVVGRPELVESALLMTRKGGTAVMVGLMSADSRLSLPFTPFIAERRLMGCDMGSNRFPIDMPRLAQFYLQGRLNLDDMITNRLPLDRINEGFDDMRAGRGIRTIIDFTL